MRTARDGDWLKINQAIKTIKEGMTLTDEEIEEEAIRRVQEVSDD